MQEALLVNSATSWLFAEGLGVLRWVLLLGALAAYAVLRPGKGMRFAAICLLAGGVLFRTALAAAQSWAQYWVWAQESFTQLFLPPHQPISYFISYVFTRYWLGVLLAVILAGAWFLFLHLLRKRTERFFDEGEVVLAALLVFAVGWPGIVVMFPVAGLVLVALSLYRRIFLKEELTTLGVPLLVGAAVTLLAQQQLLELLNLELY